MTELKCPICGTVFVPKRSDCRCCSTECNKKLYQQERKKQIEKICAECGKRFVTTNNRRKYCCELCARQAYNRLSLESYHSAKAAYKPRICEKCGKEFMPKTKRSRFCSKSCSAVYSLSFVKVKQLVCAECGKDFEATSAKRKYCCDKCAKAAVRKRNYNVYRNEERKKPCAENLGTVPICSKKYRTGDSPLERWKRMSWKEISAECARLHITYGQAQVMTQNGTLPEDFGLGGYIGDR